MWGRWFGVRVEEAAVFSSMGDVCDCCDAGCAF